MTWAICKSCGEKKFGAWIECKTCGVQPPMFDQICLLLSDHYLTKEGIEEASKQVKELKQGERKKVELAAKYFQSEKLKGNPDPSDIVLQFDES